MKRNVKHLIQKEMKRFVIPFVAVALSVMSCAGDKVVHHYYACDCPSDINAFFSDRQEEIIISGHRGGNMPGWPENCLETFDKILESMPTLYEIDPRMTKDSVIVLMHDRTLDRTTTGTGLVRDYTYRELQQFFLKDKWGNVTEYKIPKVSDVVGWSKDKVILNFDIKDVTRDVLVPLVNSLGARNCMYTVRDTCEALEVYRLDSSARMSAWIRDLDDLKKYEETGIPWENIPMAYVVSPEMTPEGAGLYAALRAKGVRCMVSTTPKQDTLETPEARKEAFRQVIATKPDVIESDFPTEFLGL